MGRHAAPAGPDGREVRQRLKRARRRRHYPASQWRYVTGGLAFAAAGAYMESTSVPFYYHPFQAAFGAVLPLALLDLFGTKAASFLGTRRTPWLGPLRPRAAYSALAVGWTLIGEMALEVRRGRWGRSWR